MLKLDHLTKEVKGRRILSSISVEIEEAKIVALLGPSGSGKTTLLRCLGRLDSLTAGSIRFLGKPLQALKPTEIGMVFQGYHLFPHLTVLENIILAPQRVLRWSSLTATEKALKLLNEFGLRDTQTCYPNQLSGGQKQRVAIARMLIMSPKLLLFDEPTSALDPTLVQDVADLIKTLLTPDRLIIMATHDLRLVKRMADQVLFLDQGQLVENCSATDFFLNPCSEKGKLFVEKMA